MSMNGTPHLPEVEKIVEVLAADVAATAPAADALWHIWGPATGGKSTALRLLAERLAGQGMLPVTISPPTRTLDAGPVAMVEAAVGLKQHAQINGQLDTLRTEAAWSDKISSLLDWLRNAQDNVVLLFDEPGAWASTASEDDNFASRADEVAVALIAILNCRRIVAGEIPKGIRPRQRQRRVHLDVHSAPQAWLQDDGAWGDLSPSARALLASVGAEDLARRSPLELRLLVALVELRSSEDVVRWWTTSPARRDIARRLAETVDRGDDPSCAFLKEAWRKLALVRRSVPDDLLATVVGQAPDQRTNALLRNCLLYPDPLGHVLHWSLRLDARDQEDWSDIQQERQVHQQLAGYYARKFGKQELAGDPQALLLEMEAFHHATMSGDSGLVDSLRPYFADQLDALGRTLSRDFGRHREAAAVFERVCAWEPGDDYAHHYLAFNLDLLADRAQEVETHYQKAIELAPDKAWWHSRWITYLVTRGRTAQSRDAWNGALDALGLPDLNANPWIYENLHLWVVRLLVHRGQLDFADEVLRRIPTEISSRHPGLSALSRRLKALVQVRRLGAVFPLSIPPDEWWQGPHLCPLRLSPEAKLVRWMPARVDAIDEAGLHLHAAEPPSTHGVDPVYGSLTVAPSDFDRWTQDEHAHEIGAGRFVELAWYEGHDDPVIRVYRASAAGDPDIPPLFPDPARYLRAAGWVKKQP
ncbi:MAG: tetratricopeptide repeat protein [Pseudomonadota bacterium]